MQRSIDDRQLTRGEVLLLSLFLVVMTVEIGVEYYSGKGISWALLLFRSLSMLTPLFAGFMIIRHALWMKTYRSVVCLYFLFILLWTLPIYIQQNENVSIFSATIYFAIPLGVSLEHAKMQDFKKPFIFICFIGICCFFFIWFTYDLDIAKALRRGYTWTDIFFWSGVFWAIIPITLYSVINNCSWKYRLLVIGYWICGVIFYLIFLKRFIIVDSALILAMIGIFLFSEGKITIKRVFGGLLISGMVLAIISVAADSVVGLLWDGVMGRFSNTSINEFDRFEESRIYFSNSNLLYILFGKGLLGGHSALEAGLHEALHVGWTNLIHKGGLVLFICALWPTIKAILLVPRMKELDSKTKWAVCVACVYSARLVYTNMHAHYPEMMMVFYSYAVIMNYNPTEQTRKCRYIK